MLEPTNCETDYRLTCVDISFTSGNKVRCVENSVLFYPPVEVDFSITLEAI